MTPHRDSRKGPISENGGSIHRQWYGYIEIRCHRAETAKCSFREVGSGWVGRCGGAGEGDAPPGVAVGNISPRCGGRKRPILKNGGRGAAIGGGGIDKAIYDSCKRPVLENGGGGRCGASGSSGAYAPNPRQVDGVLPGKISSSILVDAALLLGVFAPNYGGRWPTRKLHP